MSDREDPMNPEPYNPPAPVDGRDYEPDDYYPDAREPYYIKGDQGYGTCHECGSGLENWGACSDGDGDLYDELGCPNCQEQRGKANERWLDDDEAWLDVRDTFEDGSGVDDAGDLVAPSDPSVDDIPW